LDAATLAYGTTSQFDMSLLNKAVESNDLPTAIAMLSKAYKAAESTGNSVASSSPLLKKIKESIDKNTIGGSTTDNTEANILKAGTDTLFS
jgi:hypothetical protein